MYAAWLMLLLLCQAKVAYVTLLPFFASLLIRQGLKNGMMRGSWHPFLLRAVVIPIAGICIAQAIMHTIKFGSPFLSGYHQNHDPTFPHTFLSATEDFLWGWQGSIFVHFPVLFLAAFGARRFIRLYPDETLFLLGCMLVTYVLIAPASGPWRGQLAYGPRFFVVFLPLVSLPALYPLEWMFARPLQPRRFLSLAMCAAAALFLAAAQMEINRMDYFFKYTVGIQPTIIDHEMRIGANAPRQVVDYFSSTNFVKINWDHLRCQGHWERLPYYSDLLKHITPENLKVWQQFVEQNIFLSNLYWFPDVNRW